jgi:hypothetical protein
MYTDQKYNFSCVTSTVEVIRHDGACYEVVAYNVVGHKIGHRMYCYGSKRREWAIEQAQQWAEKHYLRIEVYE